MSTMDRAFIKAYADDVPPSDHPAASPAKKMPSRPALTRPTQHAGSQPGVQQSAVRHATAQHTATVEAPAPAVSHAAITEQTAPTAAETRGVPTPHARFPQAARSTEVEPTTTRPASLRRPTVAPTPRPIPGEESVARTASPQRPAAEEKTMPLSAYSSAAVAASAAKPESRFKAGLEVDHFVWPSICGELASSEHLFDALAEEIIDEAARGHKVVAVSSCRRGEGRTSVVLCVARRLASSGVKVCMIDADFHNPQLGRRLGIAAQVGWDAIVSGEQAVTEVLINSLDDRLMLLPLRQQFRFEGHPPTAEFADMMGILRDHFDVVLVDSGPLLEGSQAGLFLIEPNSGIEAAVLVSDVRTTPPEQIRQGQRLLSAANIRCTGMAENFVQI